MAPVTTSSDKNEESKKEDSAAPITSTRVLSPDTLDRYGRLQDALRNFDKDYQSLATPLMDMDQDGEPPFDTDVALEILEKDWARIVAISDTLEDWSPFATDFALGKTLLNRFREFEVPTLRSSQNKISAFVYHQLTHQPPSQGRLADSKLPHQLLHGLKHPLNP
jgi:hypothetical protein